METVCARLLAQDPSRRFLSADIMRLHDWMSGDDRKVFPLLPRGPTRADTVDRFQSVKLQPGKKDSARSVMVAARPPAKQEGKMIAAKTFKQAAVAFFEQHAWQNTRRWTAQVRLLGLHPHGEELKVTPRGLVDR